MKPHSVFLRKDCILPDCLDPLREPVGENWTLVEEITAPVLDTMIRRMGWHFLWVNRPCSRRGFGRTREDAAQRALARALKGLARRFNAAELVSVDDTKYPGFHVAIVTLQPRQIQQYTSLEIAERGIRRRFPRDRPSVEPCAARPHRHRVAHLKHESNRD